MDQGHENLINDLEHLLSQAKDNQYHDYKNTELPAPKIALRGELLVMADNVVKGRYDNEPDEDDKREVMEMLGKK